MDALHKHRARRLRREMTPTEKRLWAQFRDRRFAQFKFRRQQPIGIYTVDFFCPSRGVVIELNGESHVGKERYDENRSRWLRSRGYALLSIWDTEVYENFSGVLELIYNTGMERPPLTPGSLRSPRPSPSRGEGKGNGTRTAARTHINARRA